MSQRKIENSPTQSPANDDLINNDNYLYSASANDMTGLAPTVAHDEYEAQSYEELYPYLPPIHPISNGPTAAHTSDHIHAADGIHAEYRTHVTKQNPHDKAD